MTIIYYLLKMVMFILYYLYSNINDGYYGRMAHTDGVYTVNNQQVHLTFNQNHDGTFGAITSGLSSLQSTGVASQDVAGLPTESTGANTGGSGQSVDNTAASNNQTGNNGGLTADEKEFDFDGDGVLNQYEKESYEAMKNFDYDEWIKEHPAGGNKMYDWNI